MSIITLNNRALRSATAVGTTTALGAMTFIKKLTASSSATLSFVDGASDVVLDNTYKEYLFTFNNIHPATNGVQFLFQGSTNTGSAYGVTATTTYFDATHNEGDSAANLGYDTDDQAQSTDFIYLNNAGIGNDNDQSGAGYLHLFNPSSTTFAKHFLSENNGYTHNDYFNQAFVAGYFNTTSAIDAIQFKFSSGNMDAGDICLYGIN